MNSFVTFRYQNQVKVRSFVGKKIGKNCQVAAAGWGHCPWVIALAVVSDLGVGRIIWLQGAWCFFDPEARAYASHHGLSWQVGKLLRAMELRQTWMGFWMHSPGLKNAVKRACPPLQTTTNTRLPPRFRRLVRLFGLEKLTSHDHRKITSTSRPESVATWSDSGLLRCREGGGGKAYAYASLLEF